MNSFLGNLSKIFNKGLIDVGTRSDIMLEITNQLEKYKLPTNKELLTLLQIPQVQNDTKAEVELLLRAFDEKNPEIISKSLDELYKKINSINITHKMKNRYINTHRF